MQPVEVLLVEDNTGDALLVQQALFGCPFPVNLHLARDGEQALLLLTNPQIEFQLIILDLNIPKITGSALLRRWSIGSTPVVVFSSSTNVSEKERSLALGAREFISKPTDLEEFTRTVCSMVERWASPQGTAAGL